MKLDIILSKAFLTTDAVRAFTHFRVAAASITLPADYQLRQDVALARHNVDRAMSVMSDRLPDVSRLLPSVDVVALAELPSLALAVLHAADRVPVAVPSAREIDAAIAVVRPLRAAALSYMEVVADLGLVPAGRVRAIREGTGKLDEARDCVALVALFREYATALTNRHPFTDEQFKTLTDKGTWLIHNITPTNGLVSTRPPGKAERLDRDRLVRLLEQRYEQLRIAGAVCFGLRDVDAKVPPLWSATRTSSPPAEEPVPTPVPVA